MKALLGVLSLWTTLFLAVSAPAKGLNEADIVARESLAGEAGKDGNVGFNVFLDREGNAWTRADFSEAERFVKYGPNRIDRNEVTKVSGLDQFEGLFKHDGEIYLIGKRRPYKVDDPENEGSRKWVYPQGLKLYKVSAHHGEMPQKSYVRNFLNYATASAAYLAIGYASYSLAIESPSAAGLGWVLAAISAVASPAMAYAAIDGGDGRSDLSIGSYAEAVHDRRTNDWHTLTPSKIDASKPWSAENIKLQGRRGKARMLSTWVQRLGCQDSLVK